jgi:hypothetical protein
VASSKVLALARTRQLRSVAESPQGTPLTSPRRAAPRPYSVLIVLNEGYKKFGTIFLNSLHKNADVSRIRKIFVGDTGLSPATRSFMSSFERVQIVETGVSSTFRGIHSDDWLQSVAVKSRLLCELAKTQELPICMIDADCLVRRDFAHVLDPSFDLQVCVRSRPVRRRDGIVMRYIGSFLVVHSQRAASFLDSWVREIEHMYQIKALPAHETPALCRSIERYRQRLRIGALAEAQVSCDRSCEEDTLLIHMKSNNRRPVSAETSFLERIAAVRNYRVDDILTYL